MDIRLPRLTTQPRAPKPIRAPRRPQIKKKEPYPAKPKWFQGYLTEWIVYHDLVFERGWKRDKDFTFQRPLLVPGLYSHLMGFMSDFWVIPNGKGGNPFQDFPQGVVLDPFDTFTHDPAWDFIKNMLLNKAGYSYAMIPNTLLLSGAAHDTIDKILGGSLVHVPGT
jgi:hypothetical protein